MYKSDVYPLLKGELPMKKTNLLLAGAYSIFLLGTMSAAHAEPISYLDEEYIGTSSKAGAGADLQMPYTTTAAQSAGASDISTVSDLAKYVNSQGYQSTNPELGNILYEKYNGAWSNAGMGLTTQFQPDTKQSAFDAKYDDLTKQLKALQSNGTMDPTERDKQLSATMKQIETYTTANKYNEQKLVLSTKYGIPMTEIDSMMKNLGLSGTNSYYIKPATSGMSPLEFELFKTAEAYGNFNLALDKAGTSASIGKLLQNNSMISLQANTVASLAQNTIYQAGQWTEAAVQQQIKDKLEYLKVAGIPESAWGDVIKNTITDSKLMSNNSASYSTLFAQTGDLYGDTVDTLKAQYAELEDAFDEEYMAMKDKVAAGLATQADLDALIDSNADILAEYQDQIDLASLNYDSIQTGMMDTLSSKGYTNSGFFSGSTNFSGGSSLSSFLGGSGGGFAGFGGGGGGSSGGGAGNPLVKHGG